MSDARDVEREDGPEAEAGAERDGLVLEGAEPAARITGASAEPEIRYSDTNLPRPGDVIAERYRIESELGRGGMAVVYAATQLPGTRRVALKWMFEGRSHREERRRRFLREARAAGSIQHPNVVRVHDAGEHANGVFLAMELVEGDPLTTYLERGPMTPSQAVDLLMSALRGVAAAHRQGVVHRDLKPENLQVVKRERAGQPDELEIKVLDFGLSKLMGPAADSLHTLPGMLVGTPQYMAPEQADGRIGAVGERADIYTLATILYEAVAGRKPLQSETLAGFLMQLAHEEPTPLEEVVSDLPDEFASIVMWALHRDPILRPSTVEDFAIALEPYGTVPFAIEGRATDARVSAVMESMRAPKMASERPAAKPSERAPAMSAAKPSERPPAPVEVNATVQRNEQTNKTRLLAGIGLAIAIAIAMWFLSGPGQRPENAPSSPPTQAPAARAQPVAPPVAQAVEPAPAPAPSAPVAPSEQAVELAPTAKDPKALKKARAAQENEAPAAHELGAKDKRADDKTRSVLDPWEQ